MHSCRQVCMHMHIFTQACMTKQKRVIFMASLCFKGQVCHAQIERDLRRNILGARLAGRTWLVLHYRGTAPQTGPTQRVMTTANIVNQSYRIKHLSVVANCGDRWSFKPEPWLSKLWVQTRAAHPRVAEMWGWKCSRIWTHGNGAYKLIQLCFSPFSLVCRQSQDIHNSKIISNTLKAHHWETNTHTHKHTHKRLCMRWAMSF